MPVKGLRRDPWAIGGVVCLFAGALLLLLAWYDISGTADVWRQTPYLVSAGFPGLGLIVLGSALIVAGRHDRVDRRLAQLVDAITEAAGTAGAPATASAATPADSAADPGGSDGSADHLVVPGGRTYHRSGCLLLRDKTAQRADPADIASGRLQPCPVCGPSGDPDQP